MILLLASSADAWYAYRYQESATDCTSLTGGKIHDLCFEIDSNDLYKCVPASGDCDTPSEWQRTGNYTTVELYVFNPDADVETGNGKTYLYVPARLNGLRLIAAHGQVVTVGTTGTTDIQFARCSAVTTGNACSGTANDMLSTKLTIDSNEDSSDTAATSYVINSTYAAIATGQVIRIDVDAVSTTAPQGLILTLTFAKI